MVLDNSDNTYRSESDATAASQVTSVTEIDRIDIIRPITILASGFRLSILHFHGAGKVGFKTLAQLGDPNRLKNLLKALRSRGPDHNPTSHNDNLGENSCTVILII